jgi:hypothetical protein
MCTLPLMLTPTVFAGTHILYRLKCRDSEAVYIRQTRTTLLSRLRRHFISPPPGMQSDLQLYGPDSFSIRPLFVTRSCVEMNAMERKAILEELVRAQEPFAAECYNTLKGPPATDRRLVFLARNQRRQLQSKQFYKTLRKHGLGHAALLHGARMLAVEARNSDSAPQLHNIYHDHVLCSTSNPVDA